MRTAAFAREDRVFFPQTEIWIARLHERVRVGRPAQQPAGTPAVQVGFVESPVPPPRRTRDRGHPAGLETGGTTLRRRTGRVKRLH